MPRKPVRKDLTVNPFMVQWNKNFAARLNPLKGMKIGVIESNGGGIFEVPEYYENLISSQNDL